MSPAMHFLAHSMHRLLCLNVGEGILITCTYHQRHYPSRATACGLCFIWQPSSVRNYSACCSRHSTYVFFNPLLLRIDKKFTPSPSDRGFLFEGFFQNPYTSLISVITQQFIFLAIDSIFYFGYFFYNNDFRLPPDLFHTPHCSRNY